MTSFTDTFEISIPKSLIVWKKGLTMYQIYNICRCWWFITLYEYTYTVSDCLFSPKCVTIQL